MAKLKVRPPIQVAGIRQGGFATDGDSISFALQAHDDRLFNFSIPHEAVGELVATILAMADLAAERRPAVTSPERDEAVHVARAFPLQRFEIAVSPDDATVVLTLKFRNVLTQTLKIQREDARVMGESLLDAVKRISN